MAVRQRLVALMIVAMLAALILPSMALAVDPQFSPRVLVEESFDTTLGAGVRYQVTAHDPAAPSFWGISPAGGYLASGGMYAAGAPILRAAYEEDTGGMVKLLPSESLANYYSSQVSFRMLQPSVGLLESASAPGEPAYGFSVKYKPFTENIAQPVWFRSASASWASKTVDLSNQAYPTKSLSRVDGEVWFNFNDGDEVSGTRLGIGPTIDDVKLTGWKYGPPRSATAAITAAKDDVRVGWTVPALHPGSTSPDTRGPSYRIWRTLDSVTYTDVSGDVDGTHATAILDPIVKEGVTLSYVVQAWDPASGPGYGQPATVQVAIPSNPPTVTITAPAASYVAADGALLLKAHAADVGSGLKEVTFSVRRANGEYFNGTSWGATKSQLQAEYDAMADEWRYSFSALKADVSYTIVATAKDVSGLTGTATVTTTDSVPRTKPVLAITSKSAVLAYGGTGTVAGTLKTVPAGSIVVLQSSTDNVTYNDGPTALTSATGAFSFSVKPSVYTRYKVAYLGDVDNEPASSASWISMTPKVKLTASPWITYGSSTTSLTKLSKSRTYTWRTTIWPKHTGTLAGSYFQIYKRNSSGVYKSYKTLTASMDTAYTSSTSSRMKANYKITSAGTYRVRAYHNDDGHAGTYSTSWKYFTVK